MEAINSYMNQEISLEELARAEEAAEKKLAWIIKRHGDEDGIRRQPWYLEQLIKEAIAEERFSNYTMARSRELTEKKGRLKNRRPNPKKIISPATPPVNSKNKKEEDR